MLQFESCKRFLIILNQAPVLILIFEQKTYEFKDIII